MRKVTSLPRGTRISSGRNANMKAWITTVAVPSSWIVTPGLPNSGSVRTNPGSMVSMWLGGCMARPSVV